MTEVRTNLPAAQPCTAQRALIQATEFTSRAVRPCQYTSRLSLARTQLLCICTYHPVNPWIRKAIPGSPRAVGMQGQAGGGTGAARWGCSPLPSTAGCSWSRDSAEPDILYLRHQVFADRRSRLICLVGMGTRRLSCHPQVVSGCKSGRIGQHQ